MSPILCVMMEKSDLLELTEEQTSLKEEWRSVSATFGGQCVMTVGILEMQQWCAVNLTSPGLVCGLSKTILVDNDGFVYMYPFSYRCNCSH